MKIPKAIQQVIESFEKLPGIGPKMAQRIIDERSKKPFASVEELRRVSGIGPKTLEKLRPLAGAPGTMGLASSGTRLRPPGAAVPRLASFGTAAPRQLQRQEARRAHV